MPELSLIPHPARPARRIESVTAGVERLSETLLRFRYAVHGDIGALALPPPSEPLRADNLWQTTCFEAFLKPSAGTGYREFNFSPSGQWAAYAFAGYRDPIGNTALLADPQIELHRAPDRLDLTATLSIDLPDEPYRLGLSVVIEEIGHGLSYWALGHSDEKPDFHHDACFAHRLPAAKRS